MFIKASIPIMYGLCALASIGLSFWYSAKGKEKNIWAMLMLIAASIANLGYLALSISQNLHEAMLANRIAYLGSAFVPVFTIMTAANICGFRYKKTISYLLVLLGAVMFMLSATAGYSDLFYKSVSYEVINGAVSLVKEYGTFHRVYSIYVILYFILLITVVLYSIIKKRLAYYRYSIMIVLATFGNVVIWAGEHFVDVQYEFLSVAYVLTGALFVILYEMMARDREEKTLSGGVEKIHIFQRFRANLSVDPRTNLSVDPIINLRANLTTNFRANLGIEMQNRKTS